MKILIRVLLIVSCASSLNILVYNIKFGRSHSNYMGRIADVLAEAGHNVTSLIPELNPEIFDGTTRSSIIRIPQDPDAGAIVNWMFNGPQFDTFTQSSMSWLNFISGSYFGQMLIHQCDALLNDDAELKRLQDVKFDVLITETVDYCGVGIYPLVKAKSFISLSTTPVMESAASALGIPHAYSHNPSWGLSSLNPHSLLERLWNVIDDFTQQYVLIKGRSMFDAHFADRYGKDFPSMEHIVSRSVFHFTNSEPLLDFARPLLTKVINLGGLGAQEPMPLDESWDSILNLRTTNVLVSFGSIAQSHKMTIDIKRGFLRTFTRLPNVTFIWKYEEPEDEFATSEAAAVENLRLVKWTPQNDLLADHRLTLFISHGGAGSMFECAQRGVPGVFIPLFGDQPRNAGMMQHAGLALVYDKFELTNDEKLALTVKQVLDDPGFFENAKRMAFLLSRRPFSPEELLVKHVEFAGISGEIETMIPASLDLNFIQYYMIDVACLALCTIAFSRLPNVTFIWKYEEPEDEFATSEAAAVENLRLVKWTPQNDLLADHRLTLFISHGGAGSTFECAQRGVPGIFIPLNVDQPRNSGMMQHAGVALVYDKFELTNDEKLASIIKQVLEGPRFAENAKRMAFLLSKRPFTPEELLLEHVEFAGISGKSKR